MRAFMCRLLAIVGGPVLAQRALEAFHDLSHCGCVRPWEAPGHSEGWGIACYRDGQPTAEYVARSAGPAKHEERTYRRAVARACATPARLVVAHFRKATHGTVCVENVHPFLNGEWLYAHNGTIAGLEQLGDLPLQGTTDSERLLAQWCQCGRTLAQFAPWVEQVMAQCRYTSATSVLSDGRALLALRKLSGLSLKPVPDGYDIGVVQSSYYTLYHWHVGEEHLICSEVLSAIGPEWRALENGEQLVIPL